MKVLLLNESDINGGAARATYRLHQGLRQVGTDSQMLVRARFSRDRTVIAQQTLKTKLGPAMNFLPLKFYPSDKRGMFSPQWFPDDILAAVDKISPDIVALNWVCNGYLKIETIPLFKQPLVWILHDLWPLTGGCHDDLGCDRYQDQCGRCPQLASYRDWDMSRWIWQRKARAWANLDLTIVAPSEWMANRAAASSLFRQRRIETIPHGLDTTKYHPIGQTVARDLLKLPQDRRLVLFGALDGPSNRRKGYHLLLPTLQHLAQQAVDRPIELVIFGTSQPEMLASLPFKVHLLDKLNDDVTLALAYSAADLLLVPSMQESFGQTASEALACGTPVVAFNATGLRDIIDHHQNGYLAEPFNVKDLAQGVAWVLQDQEHCQKLGQAARQKALQSFSVELQAKRYLSLFDKILRERQLLTTAGDR
jgi:glycosyltransferase involved in cell wall biosynthesis